MQQPNRTLRLDPRLPLVWRTPTSIQLGVDVPVALLERISPGEERMLHALVTGVSLDGLRMIGERSGAPPRSVARLLRRVSPALVQPDYGAARVALAPAPLAGHTISVCGGSAARPAVEGLLRRIGAGPPPGAVAGGDPSVVAEGDPGAGARHPGVGDRSIGLAVIVSSWSTPPGEAAIWLRRDIPHLDVVFSDREVTVGPLVVPGEGACLHCRERHRIDRDPSWPAIAGQLYGRPAPTEVTLLIARVLPVVAGMCVAQLRPEGRTVGEGAPGAAEPASAAGATARDPGAVTHIDAITGELRISLQPVHPECACRALPGSAMAGEPGSGLRPSPPTRAPAVV